MMSFTPSHFQGKRVLIVEDEMLIAMMIEDILLDLGCNTIGPCGTVAMAMEAIRNEVFDLAVLDINLGGEMVYPVANLLDQLGIPFLFVSGYGDGAIPTDKSEWKVCTKPFRVEDLVSMLSHMIDQIFD